MAFLVGLGLLGSLLVVGWTSADEAGVSAAQAPAREAPRLLARISGFQGDAVKKRKGPPGFDLEFQLVGHRFDGAFGLEGIPQTVPEGEAFSALIKLTNIGKKAIRVAGVTVTGDGISLTTNLIEKKVLPRTASMVASFKIPAQSSAGSTFTITVALSNGDKHRATLSFAKAS